MVRVWAEPESGGGEAYVPLSPTDRARSLAIWEDAAGGGRRVPESDDS